jgi:phosphoribosylformimino-5-aminoimidazole carboxamide ribotide isomerase
MRIVGVIDVRGGRAVHAVGGRRAEYAPVTTAAGVRVDGDARMLAHVYVNDIGTPELYVADLDAIEGGIGVSNDDVVAAVAGIGVPVWLDAGASNVDAARAAIDLGASTVVIGLETLSSFDALAAINAAVGPRHVAFSIDLREGKPIVPPNATHGAWSVTTIAERAAAARVASIIVLDLARVGTRSGIDVALMRSVRQAVPGVALFVGGGVRSEADVDALRDVGCDGALVGTALLSGAVRADAGQSRMRNLAD